MKKFFSLFCAALFALGVSAESVFVNGSHQAKLDVFLSKHGTSTEFLNAAMHKHATMPAEGMSKAPAQAAEDVALTCGSVEATYLGTYYANEGLEGLWGFDFYNGNNIVLSCFVQGVDGSHIVGNYTFPTDGTENQAAVIPVAGDTIYIVSGSLSVVYSESTKTYDFDFTGIGEDGKTYTLSYSCVPDDIFAVDWYFFVLYMNGDSSIVDLVVIFLKDYTITPTEFVDIVFTETEVDPETNADLGIISFYGDGDAYFFLFYFYAKEGVVGHYTEEDVYRLNGTSGSFIGDYASMYILPIFSCSFDISVDLKDPNTYALRGHVITTDEIQYNVVIGNAPEGIENVVETAKAVKRIENGQLIIERNGVEYNVMGAQVK